MNAKVTHYVNIGRGSIEDLHYAVHERMKGGWQPLGGAFDYNNGFIMQTMVKYEDNNERI